MNSKKENKECLVVMPVEDDCPGYNRGHFRHVYNQIIRPSIENAGFYPIRADEINPKSILYEVIIEKIATSPIAIFDLSTGNDRIITGLQIRQAFNRPTIVLADNNKVIVSQSNQIKHIQYEREIGTVSSFFIQLLISDSIRHFTCKSVGH
ncbi:hypothetical protein LJC05_02665 [Bacteroides sp. OttesenSCG-928-J23]|nr:hypothetical protein [Bacteroides sp. OttesenSCG-928-J23]